MGENCTMVKCDKEIAYTRLGVCRTCYSRIWWMSQNHNKSMEDSKAALIDLDSTAERHGLNFEGSSAYIYRRRSTS